MKDKNSMTNGYDLDCLNLYLVLSIISLNLDQSANCKKNIGHKIVFACICLQLDTIPT